MILAPFSDWRAALGTTFIIDLWFSGIIVAGLIAFRVVFQKQDSGGGGEPSCWRGMSAFNTCKSSAPSNSGRSTPARRACQDARVTVHPRPVSPFNWTVFVSDDEAHRFAHVNLVRKEPRRYQPGDGFIAQDRFAVSAGRAGDLGHARALRRDRSAR